MTVWGLVRAYDEHWLLGEQSHSGSVGVQVAGLLLALAGVVLFLRQMIAQRAKAQDPNLEPSRTS
jgi:hypothetical protein